MFHRRSTLDTTARLKARSLDGGDYDLLPTTRRGFAAFSTRSPLLRWTRRRRALLAVVTLLVASLGFVVYVRLTPSFWDRRFVLQLMGTPNLPPLYPEWRKAEAALPQHQTKKKEALAGRRKYLWIAGHTTHSGWGNFMQDMIMNAHVTYASGRGYVFDDFVWEPFGPEYTKFNGKLIPARIPMSALISGPLVGGPYYDGDNTPPAISVKHFKKVCPRPTYVDAGEVRALHGDGATAQKIVETWVEHLSKIDDPCVEVRRETGNLFHIFMFGHKDETLPVWSSLSQSPVLKLFGWSALAHSAFEVNRGLFSPRPLHTPYTTMPECPHCEDPYAPLDGLLAVHLRRGDFLEHCPNLCHWGAAFNAFNDFPELLDQWEFPQGTDEERMAVYLKRCIPSYDEIVEKIRAILDSPAGKGLKNIYVMTNGKNEWLAGLKTTLRNMHDWDHIATSRDLMWTLDQKYVSQTTDMLIGERAQVFVGNGFSSMTSNIVMLRTVRGIPDESTRMW